MLKWNDKTYSGKIINVGEETISVCVYTADRFQDVVLSLADVKQITEYTNEADEKSYRVTCHKQSRILSPNTYYIEFSTKPTFQQYLDEKFQEQSDMIDALLVALLEG